MKLNCFIKDRMDNYECPKCRYYARCLEIVKKVEAGHDGKV